MDEAVDPAEALDESGAPGARGVLVEEVDRAAVPALGRKVEVGGKGVECSLVAVGPCDGGASRGEPFGDKRSEATADSGDCDHSIVKHGVILSVSVDF